MCQLRAKTIKAMSYETRQKRYLQEKAEMFEKNRGADPVALDELQRQLQKKWHI